MSRHSQPVTLHEFLVFMKVLAALFSMAMGPQRARSDDAVASTSGQLAPVEEAQVAGVVIRLTEDLFKTAELDVDETSRVRQTIVGVPNSGSARTTGQLYPDFKPGKDDLVFDLVFDGTNVSNTVSQQRTAVIQSSTTTQVDVFTPIRFDVDEGFTAGEPRAQAAVTGVNRQVSSTARGLRGAITKNIARRRTQNQEGQIQRESAAVTRQRISQENEERVEAAIERWNSHYVPIHKFLVSQPWFGDGPNLRAASDDSNLMFFVTRDQDENTAASDELSLLEVTPPDELPASPPNGLIDIIFYDNEDRLPIVEKVVTLVEVGIQKYLGDAEIADRLSIDKTSGSNWVRLSILRDAQSNGAPPQPEITSR